MRSQRINLLPSLLILSSVLSGCDHMYRTFPIPPFPIIHQPSDHTLTIMSTSYSNRAKQVAAAESILQDAYDLESRLVNKIPPYSKRDLLAADPRPYGATARLRSVFDKLPPDVKWDYADDYHSIPDDSSSTSRAKLVGFRRAVRDAVRSELTTAGGTT